MARIAAVVPDLMFGSKVKELLEGAGHEVVLVPDAAAAGPVDAAVVDLASGASPEPAAPGGPPRLAVYSHVDADMRRRAQEAGFSLVVPRSRFVREGSALVERLL